LFRNIEANKPHWSASNLRIETYNLKHLTAHFGKVLLTDITPNDIGRYQVQFRECMEALWNYLDGWDSYFADMIQTGNKMRAEAYSDMLSDETHDTDFYGESEFGMTCRRDGMRFRTG